VTATLDVPATAPAPVTARPRRRTSTVRPEDTYSLVGALVAALSLVTLVYTTLLPFSGPVGFVVLTWFTFIGTYSLLASISLTRPVAKDKIMAVIVQSLAAVLLGALIAVVVYVISRGVTAIRHSNFYRQDLSVTRPTDPLTVGGIKHAVIGTLEQITIAVIITVPLGLACAVFLNEIPGRFSRTVRTVAEAMTALPSIVAGLFIYATYILTFRGPESGFAASLALSVMMLPIIIRASDVVIRLVPGSLKEASLALGSGQWRTLWHVTLPTARSGLTTAVILGMARGIGETSPVLLTAGYTTRVNGNPFDGPQVSLPLVVLQLTRSPQPDLIARGFGAGATLLVVVLLLFAIARTIGGRGPGNLTKRQQARAASASRKEAARFERIHAAAGSVTDAPVSHVIVLNSPEEQP
jgi:phosphate transport system permease protein